MLSLARGALADDPGEHRAGFVRMVQDYARLPRPAAEVASGRWSDLMIIIIPNPEKELAYGATEQRRGSMTSVPPLLRMKPNLFADLER